jgi:hypothetical protein
LADLHVVAGAAISDVFDNRFGDPHHNLMAIIPAAYFARRLDEGDASRLANRRRELRKNSGAGAPFEMSSQEFATTRCRGLFFSLRHLLKTFPLLTFAIACVLLTMGFQMSVSSPPPGNLQLSQR